MDTVVLEHQDSPATVDVSDIRIRGIRPEDWHRLQRFHSRLSEMTVELRFHAAKRELSTPLAHYFTDLDGKDNVALVATSGTRGRIVAVARYNRINASEAEVAFVVEDRFQGQGIGRKMAFRLRDVALQNGITRFVAEILPENATMLRLLQDLGPAERRYLGGELKVTVDLI